MIGDVLFFKKTDTFISKLIAKITRSEFTHVALIVAFDNKTNVATIIESERFIRTRESRVQLGERHVIYSLQNADKDMRCRIVRNARKHIGKKYDWTLILGILASVLFKWNRSYFNRANKLICSELIDLAYYKAGVPRDNNLNIGSITPQELLEVYSLKDVRKGE